MEVMTPEVLSDCYDLEQPVNRLSIGSDTYNRIVEHLYDEAYLLDNLQLIDWSKMLAEDLVYSVPLRVTRNLADQKKSVIRSVRHYHDTYKSIVGRIARMTRTKSAFAEDPPSRTRRLITNICAFKTANPDEFQVRSSLLLTRNRFDSIEYDLMSGERHDLLRRESDGFKLARREVIVDQTALGMQNLAIFI